MALVNQFQRTGLANLSLLSATTAGWRGMNWKPVVAPSNYDGSTPPVVEAMDCMVERTTDDLLATSIQAMDEYAYWADAYMRDRAAIDPVWWHSQMTGETGQVRAMVRRISRNWQSLRTDVKCEPGEHKARVRLQIEREPWWEAIATRDLPLWAPAAGLSFIYDYTAAGFAVLAHDIVGDVPARIQAMGLQTTGGTLDRIWMGLRSANKDPAVGATRLTNFINIWECENGLNQAVAVDVNTGATASGGWVVRYTPAAPPAWEKVFAIQVSDISVNTQDQMGRFLWLLRIITSAGGTFDVQLRFGYTQTPDANLIRSKTVQTTNVAFDFLEMGEQEFPFRNPRVLPYSLLPSVYEGHCEIQVWARRTAGAGTIDFDCFCPVPMDEGYYICKDANMAGAAFVFIGEAPETGMQTLTYNTVTFHGESINAQSYKNFRLPPGDGRCITVIARATSSVIADGVIFNGALWGAGSDQGKYYERWASLRGGE